MENNQIDLINLDETKKESQEQETEHKNKKEASPNNPIAMEGEQEGSSQAIEKPLEHHDTSVINTQNQIEEAAEKQDEDIQENGENKKDAIDKLHGVRIPFGFFSHVQENRTKYLYQ